MGLFNLVENFFFISLGITCVLIMLLVFHFKQRLNDLEAKSSNLLMNLKMLIDVVKSSILQKGGGGGAPISHPTQSHTLAINEISSTHANVEQHPFSTPSITPIIKSNPELGGVYMSASAPVSQKVVVSDDEYDSDDSDEPCEKDATLCEFEINEELSEYNDESECDSECEYDINGDDSIKITENSILTAAVIPEEMVDLILEEESIDSYQPDAFIGDMSGESTVNASDVSLETAAPIEPESSYTIIASTHLEEKEYKKMNVNELRAIIISKGLSLDTSKMKKAEMVSLLVSLPVSV